MKKILRWFGLTVKIKRNPKTKITLQELYDAVGAVAASRNENFYHVTVTKGSHKRGDYGPLKLGGYIHGSNHVTGLTIEEVCDKLRSYKGEPETSPIKEVAIDL